MNKKYFFFDIDGTLTDIKTGLIIPSALKALRQLQELGHFVAIATGRAHYKARPFMESIHLDHMVCNGGNALVINHELCVNRPLDYKKANRLYHEAYDAGYGVLVMLDDSQALYGYDHRFIEQVGERQEPTTYYIDTAFDIDKMKDIYKLYISIPEDEEENLPTLQHIGKLRFVKPYLNIQHDRKREGILEILQYFDADPKDVVVFGDDQNDLVMFDSQWTSIAMGNACDDLKKKADYITDTNVDDGIWKACHHFHWL